LGMELLQPAVQLARMLAPSMVVLEDVDLIAEERGMPFGHTGPLLFELLNEMDGLRDDSDVIFVLTTNRPDILEPALAARPGRVEGGGLAQRLLGFRPPQEPTGTAATVGPSRAPAPTGFPAGMAARWRPEPRS